MSDATLHVVAESCPVGDDLVVLVRSFDTGRLFAFCAMCEATWLQPSPSRWRSADFDGPPVGELAPSGIVLPTPEEVAASAWASSVLRMAPIEDWIGGEDFLVRPGGESPG